MQPPIIKREQLAVYGRESIGDRGHDVDINYYNNEEDVYKPCPEMILPIVNITTIFMYVVLQS